MPARVVLRGLTLKAAFAAAVPSCAAPPSASTSVLLFVICSPAAAAAARHSGRRQGAAECVVEHFGLLAMLGKCCPHIMM